MTDAQEAYEERAAIIEYDGGLSRSEAERMASNHLPKLSAREQALKAVEKLHQRGRK
jgi:hypothetical protein